jgi:cell division protein FtsB
LRDDVDTSGESLFHQVAGDFPRFFVGTGSCEYDSFVCHMASLKEPLRAPCNQVGSYYPQRRNFRLTPEVKGKFTGKLNSDPREFYGREVSVASEDEAVKYGSQTMDFRVNRIARIRTLPSPQDGLRALAEKAPKAEALADTFAGKLRPISTCVYSWRRRIATIAVAVLAGLLFVHVMLGANGMIVYKQKRADYERLQQRILREQQENELYTQQIRALQTDAKAIEKEAREQLHYARPGEIVYVPQAPAIPPPASNSAKK